MSDEEKQAAQKKVLREEIDEQKTVINQLIDQLSQKTIENAELKTQIEQAFKQAANAKLSLAQ